MMAGIGARAGGEEMRMAFLPSNLDISFKLAVQQQQLGGYLLIGCGGRRCEEKKKRRIHILALFSALATYGCSYGPPPIGV